ncbi:MAG: Gfo/Idh/MocA family oxidoreductase [Patescibacteria group bacterium]
MKYPPGTKVPPQIPFVIVGAGPGSFIGNCAWLPALSAVGHFLLVGAAPSRTPEGAAWFADNARLAHENVSTSLADLLSRPHIQELSPIVCITTETPDHAGSIRTAIEGGAKWIIIDKPLFTGYEEHIQTAALLAKHPEVKIIVTFNHRYCSGIFQLRSMAQKKRVVQASSGFLQGWLKTDPGIRQSKWRTSHPLCGVLDIMVHSQDLTCFVLGQELTAVKDVALSRNGQHGLQFWDTGVSKLCFDTGLETSNEFSQAKEGHLDDIFLQLTFEDGTHALWRLEWGPEAVFTSSGNGDMDDPGQWKRHLRGSSFFEPEINGMFGGLTPPGHVLGWPDLWRALFEGIAGDIYRSTELLTADAMQGTLMNLPLPSFMDAGELHMAYAEAVGLSHRQSGALITLASVRAGDRHHLTPDDVK